MDRGRAERLALAETVTLSWHPERGGRRGWVCFDDDATYNLGPDGNFDRVADRMLSGRYYPGDAVRFDGRFRDEDRELRAGDRVLQAAPLFLRLGGPVMRSVVEIHIAERIGDHCRIGYVTTDDHYGRGIWSAQLTRHAGQLSLRVSSTASPHKWIFWVGLPIARYMQLRARTRAVEEFRKLAFLAQLVPLSADLPKSP